MKYYKHNYVEEYYRVYDNNTYEFFHIEPAGCGWPRNYNKWTKPVLPTKNFYKDIEWAVTEITLEQCNKAIFTAAL